MSCFSFKRKRESKNRIVPLDDRTLSARLSKNSEYDPELKQTTTEFPVVYQAQSKLHNKQVDVSIFDTFTDVVIITNFNGKILYINGVIKEVLYFDASQLIDEQVNILFNDDSLKTINNFYMMNTSEIHFRSKMITENNTKKWIGIHCIRKPDNIYIFLKDVNVEMNLHKMWDKTQKENMFLTQDLLPKVFPKHILKRIMNKESDIMFDHDNAIIGFLDVVDFTTQCAIHSNMMSTLKIIYNIVDKLCIKHSIKRIEFTGDEAYVAGNLFPKEQQNTVEDVIHFFLDCQEEFKQYNIKIRCGIAMGRAKSGIIGFNNYRNGIFGDTVNTASRMQNKAEPGTICITHPVYQSIENKSLYNIRENEIEHVKGLGDRQTWTITRKINKRRVSHMRHSSLPSVSTPCSRDRSSITTPFKNSPNPSLSDLRYGHVTESNSDSD